MTTPGFQSLLSVFPLCLGADNKKQRDLPPPPLPHIRQRTLPVRNENARESENECSEKIRFEWVRYGHMAGRNPYDESRTMPHQGKQR